MLDAFSNISTGNRRFTSSVLSMRGSYGLSATTLPYFIATMKLRDLQTQLTIVEDLPVDLTTGWRLQELYQREIDWKRVKHEIVKGYLRAANKLKFFNAITVALLPREKDGPLLSSFSTDSPTHSSDWPQDVAKEGFNRIDLGPVEIYAHATAPLAFLRWDMDRAIAAVIDGQHRVASLREYASTPLNSSQWDTQVPVIFLILDPRAGFDGSKLSGDGSLLHVVRELFIDLNKHAEEVSRARQILMDDREVSSIGLRSLLAERAVEYAPSERRIPLGVVDWQTDKSKFERGPFITTVVNLHICIEDVLDLRKPKDPTDQDQIDDYVQSIENALDIDALITRDARFRDLVPLKRHVEAEYTNTGRPLENIPSIYLPVAECSFNERWKPYLERVFLDFNPYKELVDRAYKAGALDGEWARWAALPKRAQEKYWEDKEQGAKVKLIDKPTEAMEQYKQERWPFYAVFQKAMLRATAYLVRHEDLLAERGQLPQRRQELAEEWIDFLNYIDSQGYLNKTATLSDGSFVWSGIALSDKKIKWSGPAVKAITGLLLLWFYRRRDKRKQSKAFVNAIKKGTNADKFPDFVGKQSGKISTTSHLGRIYAGLEAHIYPNPLLSKEEAKQQRLLMLVELIEPRDASIDVPDTEIESSGPTLVAKTSDTEESDSENT